MISHPLLEPPLSSNCSTPKQPNADLYADWLSFKLSFRDVFLLRGESSSTLGRRNHEAMKIGPIKHEAVPKCGSYEVRFSDGRPSEFFYWDDIPGRRLNPVAVDSQTALERAKAFARAEQAKLDSQ